MHEALRAHTTNPELRMGQHFTSLSPDGKFVRTLIYTGFLEPRQNVGNLLARFAQDFEEAPGEDKLFCIGAKVTSILQGRYRRVNEIHPGLFSRIATHFSSETVEHGRGVAGDAETLQAGIDEVGLPRILVAAGASAFEKIAHKAGMLKERKGVFYRIAGSKVRAIDGLVPDGGYQNHVILAPYQPDATCAQIENETHIPNAIVDINYMGGNILGLSPTSPYTRDEIRSILCDNPFGQDKRRTPIAIIGKVC